MNNDNTPQWLVAYTASRCEKKVRERLQAKGITCYLPIQTVLRQWKYRKKRIEVPVISGTIFVHVAKEQQLQVLQTQGVVTFLKLKGENHPAVVPDRQMETFMFLLDFSDEAVEIVNENLALGDLVTVVKGPLKGLEGELCSFNGENKIIVRIESLGCAMVNIPSTYVESLTIHTP